MTTSPTLHTTTYAQLLERVISNGIAEVLEAYKDDDDPDGSRFYTAKREGAIAGFESCRGKLPEDLVRLYESAHRDSHSTASVAVHRNETLRNHWRQRYYELQIEWVLNVLSVGLSRPLLAHLPTYRGAMKYAEIVGVHGEGADA
jgi:hypothetical protein